MGIFFLISLISVGFVWQFKTQIAKAADGTPTTMGFTGRLKDSNGTPLNGDYDLVIKLYDAAAAGNLIWGKSYTDVPVSAGFFTIILGNGDYSEADSGSPLYSNFSDVPFDENYYLATKVEADAEMTPRTPVSTVPFAFTTRSLQPLGSAPASPEAGWIYFDSTGGDMRPYVYNGTSWLAMVLAGHSFTGDVTGTLDADDNTALTFNTSASLSGDHTLSADGAKFGASGLIFEGSTADSIEAYIAVSDPTLTDKTYTFSGASGTVITDANFTTSLDGTYVNVGESPAAGDITGSFSGGLLVGANTVDLGTDTVGNYVETLSTSVLTGLTGGAAGSEGTDITLALDYSQALSGNVGLAANATVFGANGMVVEGDTADTIELFFDFPDPATSDKTVAFRDASGTVLISGDTLTGDVTATFDTDGSTSTTIADNSVDGTDIALGSDTEGDVMYYNGTDWVRLAIGTPGQVLEVNAGATAPEWDTDSGATSLQTAYDGGSSIETAGNLAVVITETTAASTTGDLLQLTFNPTTGGNATGDALQITLDADDADGSDGNGINIIIDQSQNTGNAILVQDDSAVTLFQVSENGAITIGAATAETTAVTITDTDFTNALSIGDNNITGTTFSLTGTDAVINFNNFDVSSDGLVTFATDGAGDQINATSANADYQFLVVNSEATDITNTAGLIELNIDAGNAAVDGINIDIEGVNGIGAATDITGVEILVTGSDADADFFGQTITFASTATATTGTYEAGIFIDNADTTASSLNDGILITSSGVNDGVVDGLDVSAANITNAINVGANDIEGTTATMTFTDFTMDADGKLVFASDDAGDQITATSGNADYQFLVVNATATDVTNTAGLIDLNIDAGNAAVDVINIALTGVSGLTAGTDVTGIETLITGDDADADYFGQTITFAATANAAPSTYEAGIFIDNAENTAASLNDGILITSSGFGDGIVDGLDVSHTNITNAVNIGDNILLGTTAVVNFMDFQMTADGLITLASDGAGDQITAASGNADYQFLVLDAETVDVTNTEGLIDLNVDFGNHDDLVVASALSINIETAAAGITANRDFAGINIQMYATNVDADHFGIRIIGESANGTDDYEAGLYIDNADLDAGSMQDAIIVYSSAVNDGITDAIDVSHGNILNALNVGDNNIIGTTAVINFTNFDLTGTGDITIADGGGIDLSAINSSATTEGFILPQNATACSAATAEGQICWDTAGEDLYVGNGATAVQMNGGGGTPGGANTQVQYNDGGAFGGEAGLTYNEGTDTLTAGAIVVTTDITVAGGDLVGAASTGIDLGQAVAGGIFFYAGTGNFHFAADENTSLSVVAGTLTDSSEAAEISLTLGNDANGDTITGLQINATTASTGDADVLQGILIANLAGTNPDDDDWIERGIQVGTGWDADIYFGDTTPTIVTNGGIVFRAASDGDDLFRIEDNGGNYGDIRVTGGDITSLISSVTAIDLGEALTDTISFTANDYYFNTTSGQVGIGITAPTGMLHVSDTTTAATGASGTAAINSLTIVSGTGGTGTGTAGGSTGGAGGAISIATGTGGAFTGNPGTGTVTGGTGGALTITLGNGGDNSGNPTAAPGVRADGGTGGTFTLNAGNGGSAGTADSFEANGGGTGGGLVLNGGDGGSGGVANGGGPPGVASGGTGGAITIVSGDGGGGGSGAGTNVGGAGGALTLAGGQGGAGGEVNGAGGSVYIYGGFDGSGAITTGGDVYLGTNNGSTSRSSTFINIVNANTTAALCHTDGTGISEVVDCNGAAGDYMEMYPTEEGIETGDVVSIGTQDVTTIHGENIKQLVKSATAYDSKVIGIASDPAMAGDFNSQGYNLDPEDNPYPIALAGRVKVKISTTSDDIQPGDLLTTSTEIGRAMKATQPGQVVGKALEAWSSTSPTDTIMVFVTTSYSDANSSSQRYKTNVSGLSFGLEDLMRLRPVLFDWKNTGEQDLGFIAEEVAGVNPLLATYDSKGNVEGVRYKLMSVLLTQAVQDQQMQIEAILSQLGMSAAQISNLTQAANPVTVSNRNDFTGTIKVKGAAVFGEDSVGQARIISGDTSVEIKFREPYEFQPIVTLTLRGEEALNTTVKYTVVNETNEGFEIKLNIAHFENLDFNWHAFGAYEGKIFVSDGTTEDIRLIVKDSPAQDTSSVAVQPSPSESSGETETIVEVVDSIEEVATIESPEEGEVAGETEISVDTGSDSSESSSASSESSGESGDSDSGNSGGSE